MALRALGKTDEAIAQFEKAVEESPDLLQASTNLGDAFMAKRRYREAITRYEFVLRVTPADSDVQRKLAAARTALQKQSPHP